MKQNVQPVRRRRRQGQTRLMIYDFIHDFCQQNGFPPTIREIGKGVGLRSTSTVCRHLRVLERDQLIQRCNNRARAIRTRDIL